MSGPLTVLCAREPLPDSGGPSVFLAGPTPRATAVPSWRLAAIDELPAQSTGRRILSVPSPESRGGVRAWHHDDQVDWETGA